MVLGRTEVKVRKSVGRARSVKERRKDWVDVNGGKKRGKGDEGGGLKGLPILSKGPVNGGEDEMLVEVDTNRTSQAAAAAAAEVDEVDEWEDDVL